MPSSIICLLQMDTEMTLSFPATEVKQEIASIIFPIMPLGFKVK